MVLFTLIAQPVSTLRATSWKVAINRKIVMLLVFGRFFLKIYIFEVAKFYLALCLPNQLSLFSGSLYL